MTSQNPLVSEEKKLYEKQTRQIKKYFSRLLKRIRRQCIKCQEELQICSSWESIQKDADLLKANYHLLTRGLKEITVDDWILHTQRTILLNPKLLPSAEIAARYKQSRKYQKALPYLSTRLKQQENKLIETKQLLNEIEIIKNFQALQEWLALHPNVQLAIHPIEKKKKSIAPLPYHEYISASGINIRVGKNAKGNEKLTFSIAKGSDFWLHVSGFPGSHITISTRKGEEPDQNTLRDAIQLAIYHSKARNHAEAEVCITQCKYVSRFGKGHIGKVLISKHKTVFAKLNLEDVKRIKLIK